MSDPDKRLLLVDGSSYLYRAYHALPPLTNTSGEPTGAIYGVLSMLRRLIEDYRPVHMGVVFDAPGKTFRDELFAEYKANRPPMPDDLAAQLEPLKAVVRAMGLPLIEVGGVEADDVIGTLAVRGRADGLTLLISTGDKDMAQLVNGGVTLLNTMSNTTLDRDGVIGKFGVPPEQIIDYLALVGDTSDNIPGVPKVGPKTAAKWLGQYGSIDGIRENAGAIGGKVGESLRAHLDELDLSRQLATIQCDVDLPLAPLAIRLDSPDRDELARRYRGLGFNTWLREIEADAGETAEPAAATAYHDAADPQASYHCIQTEADLEAWLERLAAAPFFALDLETDSLDYMRARVVGVSFAVTAGEAAYLPLAHTGPDQPRQLDRDATLARLKPLLEDPAAGKLGQNLKYDMSVLANHGITLRGVVHDTMLESYCLDATAARHDMDSLAQKYLNYRPIGYEAVAGKGAKQITFDQVALDQAVDYAAEDADITLRLHESLWPSLAERPGPMSVYESIELPLLPVLSRIERTGVRVDAGLLATQSRELAETMQQLESQAHTAAGGPFNLGSPKQIQEILYERQGLPVLAKTPKGAPSTAESVLEELAAQGHDLPRLILDYRGVSKLRSTYTEKLPTLINPHTGRVHTSYHQAVAATGRLSSSDPNLQNIPIRTPEGRRIRRAFVPTPGYRLMAADYSQVELRIMAHLSGDDGLRRAFAEGQDIHAATAAEVFGGEAAAVSGDQRRAAKAINFGLIYGMSAWGLARQLGIERGEAQAYVDRYFERYPGVQAFMDRTRETAHQQGYVETVYGRRLYLPEINSRNNQRRQYAERTAINAPMQGTAADIIKRAMIAVDDWIGREQPDATLVMQVHDELVLEVPAGDEAAIGERIRGFMAAAADLDVPLEVEVGIGDDWDTAH
ncbi:DNA polymerase I [Spiribacter vilamensis]|uniref:DNA polymerase I n=1 Tax=Spiribacter vilamensis TaxID=531306 RepID=A0A4Q8D2I8_9GAMM|nr:DNA polymerase I [Spiribacter vilamensis]RZU99554.1 DNA polymerase I [Spiribacter vilamensis]TVO61477.1 DNA polymerase I [Spiribacter vilamensis]